MSIYVVVFMYDPHKIVFLEFLRMKISTGRYLNFIWCVFRYHVLSSDEGDCEVEMNSETDDVRITDVRKKLMSDLE